MQNEKQRKSIEIFRATNERMAQDLEHYKKVSLSQQNRKPKPSTQQGTTTPSKSADSSIIVDKVQQFTVASIRDCTISKSVSSSEIVKQAGMTKDCQVTILE